MSELSTQLPPGFALDDTTARMDRERIHRWLSEDAYWAIGRTRAKQDAAIEGSTNFGVFRVDSGEQVAYARVVTDMAMFAWICDVYVDRSVRGLGVGTALMAHVVSTLDKVGVWRLMLATGDAHGLYAKFGFEVLGATGQWMTRLPADLRQA